MIQGAGNSPSVYNEGLFPRLYMILRYLLLLFCQPKNSAFPHRKAFQPFPVDTTAFFHLHRKYFAAIVKGSNKKSRAFYSRKRVILIYCSFGLLFAIPPQKRLPVLAVEPLHHFGVGSAILQRLADDRLTDGRERQAGHARPSLQ